eukprot:1161593-Pelagomonas_calceolata.AAC.11
MKHHSASPQPGTYWDPKRKGTKRLRTASHYLASPQPNTPTITEGRGTFYNPEARLMALHIQATLRQRGTTHTDKADKGHIYASPNAQASRPQATSPWALAISPQATMAMASTATYFHSTLPDTGRVKPCAACTLCLRLQGHRESAEQAWHNRTQGPRDPHKIGAAPTWWRESRHEQGHRENAEQARHDRTQGPCDPHIRDGHAHGLGNLHGQQVLGGTCDSTWQGTRVLLRLQIAPASYNFKIRQGK